MYNQVFFNKIINLEASQDDLINFNSHIDEQEFDLDEPFTKYYDLKFIIKAIDKYNNKEINALYLSNWCNAYNWIICGGFKDECCNSNLKNNVISLVVDKISCSLDSLSYFTENNSEDRVKLEYDDFKAYDKILKSYKEWKVILANLKNDYYSYALVNEHTKEYLLENVEIEDLCLENIKAIGEKDFIDFINELNKKKFSNIGHLNINEI